MSVSEAQERISSREFAEWVAYYGLEPFGESIAWARAGTVCATMANRWRGKSERPYKPADFMPGAGTSQQTVEEMQDTLRQFERMRSKQHGAHR